LESLVEKHNRTANVQVVFIDVEKYSRRRSQIQMTLIDRFTELLHSSLARTTEAYREYAQTNHLHIPEDVLILPTGDGAGVLFSFEGLHDIHLKFARTLLEMIHAKNLEDGCSDYAEHGWCNCHPSFGVRIGISEGTAIFYRDANKRLNAAGRTINLAARVMSIGDAGKILFSENAFRQLVDLTNDTALITSFRCYPNVHLKDGEKTTVYQYLGNDEDYINSTPVVGLGFKGQLEAAARIFSGASKHPRSLPDAGRNILADLIQGVADTISADSAGSESHGPAPRKSKRKE
jgi:class 3 adenylate cyclase